MITSMTDDIRKIRTDKENVKRFGIYGLKWLENHVFYNIANKDNPLKTYTCGESILLDDNIEKVMHYFKEFNIKMTKKQLISYLSKISRSKLILQNYEKALANKVKNLY